MKKKTLTALVIIAALCILITVTAWAVWTASKHNLLLPEQSPTTAVAHQNDAILDGEVPVGDYEQTREALQRKVDASKFEVKINACISKDPKSGKYVALIGNTERNRYNCYVYIVDQAGGILYTSPVIKPGQYIPCITFAKPVADMDADAYFCVSDDANNLIGKVAVGIKLKG